MTNREAPARVYIGQEADGYMHSYRGWSDRRADWDHFEEPGNNGEPPRGTIVEYLRVDEPLEKAELAEEIKMKDKGWGRGERGAPARIYIGQEADGRMNYRWSDWRADWDPFVAPYTDGEPARETVVEYVRADVHGCP